jgi:hypothetical protein
MFNPLQNQFNIFMQQMKGRDPNALLNQLISSGKVSQEQINNAHKQVENLKGQFENMKKFFGF